MFHQDLKNSSENNIFVGNFADVWYSINRLSYLRFAISNLLKQFSLPKATSYFVQSVVFLNLIRKCTAYNSESNIVYEMRHQQINMAELS